MFTDASRSNQIHDYSPGNGGTPGHANGLFWTTPITNKSVRDDGDSVVLELSNYALIDAFQLFHTQYAPAILSVRAIFPKKGTRVHQSETSIGSTFVFDGVNTNVDVQFTTSSQVSLTDPTPFTFTSTGPTSTAFGRVGHERNGSFA